VWDEGDADANLGRVDHLIGLLQGPNGSGQPFADDAETLILIATSHFELHERGYALLLDRVRTLSADRQRRVAMAHASSMGRHPPLGVEATYARHTRAVRVRGDLGARPAVDARRQRPRLPVALLRAADDDARVRAAARR